MAETHRRKRAFTLVELLVVIGIIAVLISILLPSLNRAREAGNRAQCLSNLKQLMIATVMYMNENKGKFPYQNGHISQADAWGSTYQVGFALNGIINTNAMAAPNWLAEIYPYLAKVPTGSQSNAPRTFQKLLLCAAQAPLEGNGTQQFDGGTGYFANGIATYYLGQGERAKKSSEFTTYFDRPNPSRNAGVTPYWNSGPLNKTTWLNKGWRNWAVNPGNSLAEERTAMFPHRKGRNHAFLDGHAAFVPFDDQRASMYGLEMLDASNNVLTGVEPVTATPAERLSRVKLK